MEDMLTLKEVASKMKLSEKTVMRHVTEGNIKASKLGKLWRFTTAEVEKYIKSRTIVTKKLTA